MKQPCRALQSSALKGTAVIPGDKSISHRSLMLGGIAEGETVIAGLLEGEDVLNTAAAMEAMGARVTRPEDPQGLWRVHGVGLGYLKSPDAMLDMGNSGTSARLLMGLLAGHEISATMTGDASLKKRPMGRVMTPLTQMGARFDDNNGGRLPITVHGVKTPKAITYTLPVASAQVKSAIMLAGLTAAGSTTVIEPKPTRDHSEIMLKSFGASIATEELPGGGWGVTVTGGQPLKGQHVHVPSDPSSAAFLTVAALIVPGSEILLPGIGMNPRRTGLYDTLLEMGADITFENRRLQAGEDVADIRVRASALKGVDVPPERAPSMIDEYPILSIAASCADGVTRMTGLDELRVKESDRLAMIATGLAACGVKVRAGEAELDVFGTGRPPRGGAEVATALDHRIAMSFLILGGVTAEPVSVDDAHPIATSFPGFIQLMNGLGARIGFAGH